jgi:hypothetical protein
MGPLTLASHASGAARFSDSEAHSAVQVLPKYDVLKYDQISDLKQTQEFWHAGVQVRVWQGVVEGADFCGGSSSCTQAFRN